MRVTVFGDGRIGTALTRRLASAADAGEVVENATRAGWKESVRRGVDIAVLSVTHGSESQEIVGALVGSGAASSVIDLTTQSVASAEVGASIARGAGMRHAGGGLTGGLDGVETGSAVVLLGGCALTDTERRLLASIGSVVDYPCLAHAVAAKLLHNWYLLATGVAIREAISAAVAVGMSPSGLLTAIHTGPAGRQVPNHPVVRDWLHPPTTSYDARLALKDVAAISEVLQGTGSPVVEALLGAVVESLEAAEAGEGYTLALLRAQGQA